MEAKELMIGDWVLHNGEPYQIRQLGIYGVDRDGEDYPAVCVGKPKGIGLIVERNEIEPIPLTPDILEKNGWVRTKYCYGRDCMEIHGADKLTEGVDNALSMARWSIDKNYQYHFLDLYMWKGSVMQHNVHYVHQLQHAFRIFGIEKEIVL